MATHSSTLAWKIPWTEEPGRLQSMGSQRVRHDWAPFVASRHTLSNLSLTSVRVHLGCVCVFRDEGQVSQSILIHLGHGHISELVPREKTFCLMQVLIGQIEYVSLKLYLLVPKWTFDSSHQKSPPCHLWCGQILFSWSPKSMWTLTTATKLKDACSLEGKLWQTQIAY